MNANPSDLINFETWLHRAKRGSRFVYHTGYLPKDKSHAYVMGTRLQVGGSEDVFSIAKMALRASDAGDVHLFQRKLGDMRYEYQAVMR